MSSFNCGCNRNTCVILAIFASIIIGFVAAILTITSAIGVTPVFLWLAVGIAILFLALLLGISPALKESGAGSCVCPILSVLLTAILGTVLTSVILLIVCFAKASIAGAIITGAFFLFLSLLIITAVCLIKCIIDCDD